MAKRRVKPHNKNHEILPLEVGVPWRLGRKGKQRMAQASTFVTEVATLNLLLSAFDLLSN
jgi:hypothetical protein